MQRIEPKQGRESVRNYPRPPQLEASNEIIEIISVGQTLAKTSHAFRVLETSHPPVLYFSRADISIDSLKSAPRDPCCAWKSAASYYAIQSGERTAVSAGWCYLEPTPELMPIRGYIAFYPSKMDACFASGERVQAQEDDFYGGSWGQ